MPHTARPRKIDRNGDIANLPGGRCSVRSLTGQTLSTKSLKPLRPQKMAVDRASVRLDPAQVHLAQTGRAEAASGTEDLAESFGAFLCGLLLPARQFAL